MFSRVATAVISIAGLLLGASICSAQTYPSRPITLMIGFAEGGPNDILGRLVAKGLARRLGQPIEVVNKAGASSNLAAEAVVRSAPDGYTLLLVGPSNAINVSLFPNLPFDFRRDIIPVAGITREALVMVVNPSVPAKSVAEFVAVARKDPAKFKMASTGNGSSPHVSGVLFNRMTGLDLPIVHFNGGGPALKDLIAGQTQMMFEPMSASIEPVRSGKLRALGVSSSSRVPALPDIPTVADTVTGYEASAVTGFGVPAGTAPAVIEILNRAINATLADPETAAELAQTGGTPLLGTPVEFDKIIAGEVEKWSQVVKAAGIKAN